MQKSVLDKGLLNYMYGAAASKVLPEAPKTGCNPLGGGNPPCPTNLLEIGLGVAL